MPTLLIVHHTPSPTMQAMFEVVLAGASTDEIEGVTVTRCPALDATAGRPYGLYVDGGSDTAGAVRTGLVHHQGEGLAAGGRTGTADR